MILYLLRHGDAVESSSGIDAERPLSQLGRRQAESAGRFLQTSDPTVGLLLCSPLLRARQMAEIVQANVGAVPLRTSDRLIPGDDLNPLLDELNGLDIDRCLLVGHEPSLSTLISLLITGSPGARLQMSKGSLARVECPRPLESGRGTLHWLLTSDQMHRAR